MSRQVLCDLVVCVLPPESEHQEQQGEAGQRQGDRQQPDPKGRVVQDEPDERHHTESGEESLTVVEYSKHALERMRVRRLSRRLIRITRRIEPSHQYPKGGQGALKKV